VTEKKDEERERERLKNSGFRRIGNEWLGWHKNTIL
jgi:hypothetical protein